MLLAQRGKSMRKEHTWLALVTEYLMLVSLSWSYGHSDIWLAGDVSDWETIGEYLEGKQLERPEMGRENVLEALRILPPRQGSETIWIRPAYDGLRLCANKKDIWEDTRTRYNEFDSWCVFLACVERVIYLEYWIAKSVPSGHNDMIRWTWSIWRSHVSFHVFTKIHVFLNTPSATFLNPP